jgi:hypothetical protein
MTAALFVALVLVMASLAFRALRQAGTGSLVMIAVALVYLVIPAVLASRGVLDRYSPMPAPALMMIIVIAIVTLGITLSPVGARVIAAMGLPALIGFQVFRIPVEWLLYRLYQEGVVPVQMTYAGRNFDLVSGVTAGVLALWLMRGHRSHAIVLAWNVLGLALLINIVAIAVLSTPVPFRRFPEGPANVLPSLFPYVWLPTVLVQMALAGHVLVFRRFLAPRKLGSQKLG